MFPDQITFPQLLFGVATFILIWASIHDLVLLYIVGGLQKNFPEDQIRNASGIRGAMLRVEHDSYLNNNDFLTFQGVLETALYMYALYVFGFAWFGAAYFILSFYKRYVFLQDWDLIELILSEKEGRDARLNSESYFAAKAELWRHKEL